VAVREVTAMNANASPAQADKNPVLTLAWVGGVVLCACLALSILSALGPVGAH
jgi:hypothetical protein